jgi:hypothetical protein
MKKHIFWSTWSVLFLTTFAAQLLGILNKFSPTENLFADLRVLCGVHNFGDVISNISFVLVGLYAMAHLIRSDSKDFNMWLIAIGSIMVGLGSAYYHNNPNNETLVWDRLPMSIVFSGIFMYSINSLRLIEKRNYPLASLAYLVFSIATVLIWELGTKIHINLITPYVFLQFGGMVLIIVLAIMAFLEKKNQLSKTLFTIIACYALAKLFEHFDFQVFTALNHIISGHSIKHIISALAILMWFKMLKKETFTWKTNFNLTYF